MSGWVEPKSEYIEVTTWARTRRHLANPDRKVVIQGTYHLVPLCAQTEADTEEGWSERYPMFWIATKLFADLPACKRCAKSALSTSGEVKPT